METGFIRGASGGQLSLLAYLWWLNIQSTVSVFIALQIRGAVSKMEAVALCAGVARRPSPIRDGASFRILGSPFVSPVGDRAASPLEHPVPASCLTFSSFISILDGRGSDCTAQGTSL